MKTQRIWFVALSVISGLTVSADDACWPCWRGRARDDISTEKGLLSHWPAAGPKLIWSADGLGIGFSSVTIDENTIYTAGVISNRTYVLALTLDGRLRWRALNGGGWNVPEDASFARGRNLEGSRATPSLDDGRVYHMNDKGRLLALDAGTGAELWAVDLTARFQASPPKWGYAESVLIDGNRLFCYPGGTAGRLVALDKTTGRTLWVNREIGEPPSYCSALLVRDKGVRQLISMSAKSVFGVDPETGRLLWRHPFRNKRGINVSTPVYYRGHVFVSSGYGRGSELLKLTYGNPRITVETVWSHKELDNHHGGVVCVGGFLYGTGSAKPRWYCIELPSGKQRYKEKGVGKGSVTVADGRLYCLGEHGTVALVDAKPEYQEHGRFKVPSGGKGLHWAHPVVCGGRLYLRHADKLFVYALRPR